MTWRDEAKQGVCISMFNRMKVHSTAWFSSGRGYNKHFLSGLAQGVSKPHPPYHAPSHTCSVGGLLALIMWGRHEILSLELQMSRLDSLLQSGNRIYEALHCWGTSNLTKIITFCTNWTNHRFRNKVQQWLNQLDRVLRPWLLFARHSCYRCV